MNRISWIDSAKGLGIIAIVLGHIGHNEVLVNYLYSFHIPLFFFIAGFLFNADKYKEFGNLCRQKIKALIIPYLVFSLISYPVWILQSYIGLEKGLSTSIYQPIIGTLYGVGTKGGLVHNAPLWFLTCLFSTHILFFVIKKYSGKNLMLATLLLLASLIGFCLSLWMPFRLAWGIDIAFSAVAFFGFGYMIKERQLKYSEKLKGLFLLSLPVWMFLNIHFNNLNTLLIGDHVDMNWQRQGLYFYFYISAFSGIFLYCLLSRYLERLHFLNFLGKHSLIIFGLHFISNTMAVKMLAFLTGINQKIILNTISGSILAASISLCILVPVILMYNKFRVSR